MLKSGFIEKKFSILRNVLKTLKLTVFKSTCKGIYDGSDIRQGAGRVLLGQYLEWKCSHREEIRLISVVRHKETLILTYLYVLPKIVRDQPSMMKIYLIYITHLWVLYLWHFRRKIHETSSCWRPSRRITARCCIPHKCISSSEVRECRPNVASLANAF